MKKVLFLALVLCSAVLQAQQLSEQNWSSEADFRKDEAIVLENIAWLENQPLATATNDTKALTEYVLNWLAGTPYISVTYDEIFLSNLTNSKKYKFGEKFRVTYLFGKSYYLIENQEGPIEAKACARGIEGMVTVYNELKKVDPSVRDSLLEKYSRLAKKDKLLTYTEAMLEKAAKNKL